MPCAGTGLCVTWLWVEKLVYGEVELRHDYDYNTQGQLRQAHIRMLDEEPTTMSFAN